jgi:very-short-patch-repair endonuclease
MPRGKTSTKLCDKCNRQISLFAFNRHYKTCDGYYKKKDYPEDLRCPHCNKMNSSKLTYGCHVRLCKENPNHQRSSHGMTGKIGSNQYLKARKLGLPDPICSEETRAKIGQHSRNIPRPYYSKLSQRVITSLLEKISHLDYGEVYYATLNKEYYLNDNNTNFCYDLCFKTLKVLVEFNGTRYHVRNLADEWTAPYKNMGTKEDVFARDKIKYDVAIKNGYSVYYIWEDSIDFDVNTIVNKITESLCFDNKN